MTEFAFLAFHRLIAQRATANARFRGAGDDDPDPVLDPSPFLKKVVGDLRKAGWTIRVGEKETDALVIAGKRITVKTRSKVENVAGFKKQVFFPDDTIGVLSSFVFRAVREMEIATVTTPKKDAERAAHVTGAVAGLALADANYLVSVLVVAMEAYASGEKARLDLGGTMAPSLDVPVYPVGGLTQAMFTTYAAIVAQGYAATKLEDTAARIAADLAKLNKARYEREAEANWKRADPAPAAKPRRPGE